MNLSGSVTLVSGHGGISTFKTISLPLAEPCYALLHPNGLFISDDQLMLHFGHLLQR